MRFLSVCSGIEAASVAWNPLGWKAVAFSEIEPFPCALLKHHYPDTPNLGDMTKYKDWPNDLSIDLLCGGTPCQSFSVAGLRKGLDDPRGNLMLTFGAIAAKYRPQWLVWENVPGVLSSNGGRDFGAFLGMLGQLGCGFAYRVLDAQYAGLAQRRKRVFVVGCLGDWRSAAAVLFERHSLSGHPAPSRKAGQGPAGSIRASAGKRGGIQDQSGPEGLIETLCVATGQAGAEICADMAPTLNCNHEAPYIAHSLRGEGFDASEDGTGRGTPLVPCIAFPERMSGTQCASTENLAPSMGALNPTAVAVSLRGREGGATAELGDEVGNCLRASGGGGDKAHVLTSMAVRRMTARECERLQGFQFCVSPDYAGAWEDKPGEWWSPDCTLIHGRSKKINPEKLNSDYIKYLARGRGSMTFEECCNAAADGPRYKALGNSWAVPCITWIGERIDAVSSINAIKKAA